MNTVAVLALLLTVAGDVAAQPATGAAPEGWAYELAEYLMSPFCPGRTISDCPSPQAKSLKMWMIVQEAAGRSREDVERELIERYGEGLRPAPRTDGFGVTAYAFPIVAFLAGGVFVAIYLRRQTHSARLLARPAQTLGPLDPELEKMIDEELER